MTRRLAISILTAFFCVTAQAAFSQSARKAAGVTTGKTVTATTALGLSSAGVMHPARDTDAGQAGTVKGVYSSLLPSNGSLINNAKPIISVEYVDEGIGINQAETKMYLDGNDVSIKASATPTKVTLTPDQPLADGLHKVRVDINDRAGNPASVSWTFTLRTQPPKIKITSHEYNQYLNKSPILVSGTVDDPKARVVLNGIAAAVEQGVFSAKVNLIEGGNTLTAVATDLFANSGSDTITVVLDSKPPTLQIISPMMNSLVNSRTITVSGTADAKAASIIVSTPTSTLQKPATISSGTFTAANVTLAEGLNTITAKAVSSAGNVGRSVVRVMVDTAAPKITLTAPKNNSLTNKKMITVTGTVDDQTAMVKVNNTPVQVSKGVFTLSGVNLAEGSNTVTATAVDRAGNQAAPASIIVVLKTVPPAPPKLGNLPFVSRDASIMVSGTAEPGSQVELFMNSSSKGLLKADENGTFLFKAVLQEGNNAFSSVASDVVGNVSASSSVVNVFYDKTPPHIL